MVRRSFFAIALLSALPCVAQFPNETERLMAATRLWVTVESFHPYVATNHFDWDSSLVTALPKIRAARNNADYRAAIASMLSELQDPETYVLADGTAAPEPKEFPASQQESVVRTATETSILVHAQATTERMVLDLPGMQVSVRLSQPTNALATQMHAASDASPMHSDAYPPVEGRLLAAIKIWGVIHYFFAYKDLVDEDWDEVFATYLPKFIQAHDAIDYNLVLADLLTHLTDTNTASHSKTLDAYFGEAPVGLRIRLLDKYPIITDVLDPAAVEAGVHPGDILKRVASESITDRFHRFVQYVPASTPQRSGYDTIQRVTNGPAGSEVELSIENAKGEAHPIKLTRKASLPSAQRTTEPVRILPGNIGYLDLDRLTLEAADAALLRVKDSKALILDLRGQAPAAAAIASHLTPDGNAAASLVTTPIALHPDITTPGIATQTATTFVVRTLPTPRQPTYKGKTVALIDERTIGDSEYAGLLFEAANKTEFVGVPSAGAESHIAEFEVPGAITITYSTQDIRHGNGGKLQRLGLQPSITAQTTAKGLRAGKDEPLEAALSHLSH